jgi:hypothetical protein
MAELGAICNLPIQSGRDVGAQSVPHRILESILILNRASRFYAPLDLLQVAMEDQGS